MRVGWLTPAIFGDLSGYFFRNVRDKSSNIIRRYTTPCCHVTYCKMNDLVVVVFQVPYRSYSCKKNQFLHKLLKGAIFGHSKLDYGVQCDLRDISGPGRHQAVLFATMCHAETK